MAAFAISVCYLSGGEIQITVEPSDKITQVRQRVEDAVGVGDFQEVKLYMGTEELPYDKCIADTCLQLGFVVQAVVTKSVCKAVRSVKSFHENNFVAVAVPPKKPPPPLPRLPLFADGILQPFRGETASILPINALPLPDHAPKPLPAPIKECIQAFDVLEDMGCHKEYIAGLHDVVANLSMTDWVAC